MTKFTEKEIEIMLAHFKKEWDYHAAELQTIDGIIQSLERARNKNAPVQIKVVCGFCGTTDVLVGSNGAPVDCCAMCLITHAHEPRKTHH